MLPISHNNNTLICRVSALPSPHSELDISLLPLKRFCFLTFLVKLTVSLQNIHSDSLTCVFPFWNGKYADVSERRSELRTWWGNVSWSQSLLDGWRGHPTTLFILYIYIIYWKMNYFWFLMLSLVVIECRLGNIRVHTRLVMCFHFQLLVAASRGFKNLWLSIACQPSLFFHFRYPRDYWRSMALRGFSTLQSLRLLLFFYTDFLTSLIPLQPLICNFS